MKAEKINAPFHPITAVEARQWYKDGLLTTSGYLWAIRRITCPPNVKFVIPNVVNFCEEWGISRAGFYRAVKHLDKDCYMSWEATHGLAFEDSKKVVDFPSTDKKCLDRETVSQKRDTKSHDRDDSSHKRDSQSHDRDTPYIYGSRARSSDKSDKQTLSDSTAELSAFLAGLADERERENFWEFGRNEAAKLKNPEVILVDKWIAKNFDELHRKFKTTKGAITLELDEKVKAKEEEALAKRKAADEFLARTQDPDIDQQCVPAPQNSAAKTQEAAQKEEVSNQQEEGSKEPKTASKGFGVNRSLSEKLAAKNAQRKQQVRNQARFTINEQELDNARRNDEATPPHD